MEQGEGVPCEGVVGRERGVEVVVVPEGGEGVEVAGVVERREEG